MQDALLEGPIGHSVVSLTGVETAFLWDTPAAAQPAGSGIPSVGGQPYRALAFIARTDLT